MRVSQGFFSKRQFVFTSWLPAILLLAVMLLVTASSPKSWGADETETVASVDETETPLVSESSGETVLRFKSGFEYSIRQEPEHPEDALAYAQIPEQEKQRFHSTRAFILKKVAALLNFSRFATGTGLMIGEKIYHTFKSRPSTSGYLDGYLVTDERVREFEDEVVPPSSNMSIKDRGFALARKSLAAIDRQLWRQAPLVARSDEFGLLISLGGQLEVGKLSQGFGGSWSLGISLGYNRAKKAVVFEIYRERESLHTALPAVSVAAVLGKLGVFIQQSEATKTEDESHLSESKGQALYPPGFPMFAETTPTFFGVGLSSALGVPPPPISDAFAYLNNLNRKTLVKLSVSPLLKGFVNIRSGLDFEFIKKVLKRGAPQETSPAATATGGGWGSCQAFFASSGL